MEEEVIIPEEETFDYNKLRYILDKDGYICHASIGGLIVCDLGECTEYTGEIPTGYSTIEEWYDKENDKLNAWKIVDGNLVFDENKYSELQILCEIQEEENKCATHKWVNDKFKNINEIYDDELSSSKDGSSLFIVTDAKEAEVVSLNLIANKTINSKLKLLVTNENMLENKGITQTIDGVTFKINEDKTITLNGTSTEAIEFILNGSMTNKEVLLFLKQNTDYMECGFTKDVNLNLYYYDGTNRELVSSGGNSTLNFDETKYITCVSLGIEKGKSFDNVKISPMLTVGEYEEKDYIEYKGEILEFNFGNYKLMGNDSILINRNEAVINAHESTAILPSNDLFPSDTLFPSNEYSPITIYNTIEQLMMFENKTIIQCDKNVRFEVKYFPKDYLNEKFSTIEARENEIEISLGKKVGKNETIASINMSTETDEDGSELKLKANKIKLEGYTTINDGFGVDTVGNMTCNNATMNQATMNGANVIGGTINGSTLNLSDNGGSINASINITNNNNSATGRSILSSDLIELDGNGHIIYLGTHQEFYSGYNAIMSIDGKFQVYNNGDIYNSNNYNCAGSITCSSLTQTSKEEKKKNFEKFNNGLELIKETDVYKYHLKTQEDDDKKHIGLIIGKKYKTPNEVIQGEGIDLYAMISIAWQSIKELNSKIDELENRIKELESDK